MADYTLNNFRNYTIFTDQTGSAIYDSGGPTGSYSTGENYYFTIAPQSSTGSLVVTIESASFNTTDKIRIYNGVPTTGTTGSFSYAGSTVNSQLIGIVSGSFGTPKYFTASAGKAYIRFSGDVNGTAGSAPGFKLSWTGSGFYNTDTSSGITYNKYGVTFPTDATSGSWMTFAPGKFTSSATLSPNKDFIFGFWAKADLAQASAPASPVIGIGTMNGGQGISIMRISSPSTGDNTMALYYYDASGSISSLTTRATDILGGGQFSLSTYPPQWNHYGFVIRKTNATTGGQFLAYKDGVLFSSASITKGTNWASISTTYDTLLGSYREFSSGQIMSGSTTKAGWSGSLDDVFVATVATGSIPITYTSFFSRLYNSGNWSDPNSVISSSFSSSLNPTVILNWRFEETGSLLNTKDYGYYGNFHTASAVGNIANSSVRLTSTSSGISSTPYSTLAYSASLPVGAASFTSASYTTTETSNLFTVYVDRVSGSAGALTSSCFFYNITAVEGVNYTDSSTQLTWADGETTRKSITIPILYDGVQTSTLSFGIYQIGSDYTTYNSAISTASVGIQDRNRGVFNWQVTSLSAYETGSVANVNITRVSGTYGNVTVQIQKSSSFGGGYASTASAYFLEGDSSKQYSISITDDFIDEPDEIVTFKMTPIDEDIGVYPLTGSNGFLALTIIDNETGSVTFSSSSAAIYENTASYYVGVERIYGGDQAETASITFVGSTYAVSGSDYNIIYAGVTRTSPFNITWADQDKTTKYITASIINDTILESNETITFGIASSSISTIGPSSSFVLTIYDYENTGSVRFATNLYSVSVGSTVNVQVERYIGADVTASAIIDVSSSSTAVAGVDYTNIFPYTVNWADQESGYKNIPIQTISSWESSKTLNLKFTSLTNLSSGSILSSSVSLVSVVYSQSAQTVPLVSSDFTINDYTSLSSQYTRRVENVPYRFVVRGPATIRGSRYKTSGE
jgi:hypothetical protein